MQNRFMTTAHRLPVSADSIYPAYEGDHPCTDCNGFGCEFSDARSDNPIAGATCRRCKGTGEEAGQALHHAEAA